MAVRPYLRGSLARSLYEKMVKDENLRSLDKSKWYDVNMDVIDCRMKELFFQSSLDEETDAFLDQSFEKSDWLMTHIFHAIVRSVLCWFMTRTSINGFLGRGSMFVYSSNQFQSFLDKDLKQEWKYNGNLLDLGAGDGKVTDVMSRHFRNTHVTEISGVMKKILIAKKYQVADTEKWHEVNDEPGLFDAISCLNLLDRCDRPVTLLHQIRAKLKPDTGLLILALVLPVNQYVETGSQNHRPSEVIPVKGKTFEDQISSLSEFLNSVCGFQIIRWTRLPYLCEGDIDQAYYWLNDAVFLLKVDNTCTNQTL